MKTEHENISKRVGTVGFYTLISRILGLGRDAVVAWAFGASKVADAFYVAFRIPNLLRRLVAEGALTIAFVPVYSEYLKKSRREAHTALSVIFTYLSLFLTALVVLGIIFAPWLVKLIAWGFVEDPAKYALTVFLTRLMFPYIFLISLVALAMGVLNSLKKFAAPAAAPILLNVGIIFGAVVLSRYYSVPVVGLAAGVLLGGIMQLALQIPSIVKEGMVPRINFNWRHPALKGLLFLMVPAAFGAAVYQINVLIVTLIASFLPEGSVSYLWYADRISEFPLGVFAIAVATATLPTMSDQAAAKDIEALKGTMNYGLRLALLIAIPSSVGLYLLALPTVSVLFQRGEFTAATATATAGALSFFALKIPFVSGVRNLVPAFFALKDARRPVIVAAIAVVVNAIAALLLMNSMLHEGLALALVISSAVNFAILLWWFRRKVGPIGAGRILSSVLRTSVASAIMGAVLWAALRWIGPFLHLSLLYRAAILFGLIGVGIAIFLAIIRVINPTEFHALMGMIRRKRKRATV